MLPKLHKYCRSFFLELFHHTQEASQSGLFWSEACLLFAAGLLLWTWFFNGGNIPFDFHDWSEITAPRLAFLKDAVIRGVLPLHMPEPRALLLATDRFLSVPDVILSPQVLLLRFLDIGKFSLVHILLLYSAGFAGLLQLARRFRLSPAAFAMLFLLFNFNGSIVAHLSIGHLTWGGYFLFPWFVLLVYRLLEGDSSWAWVCKVAGLLFVILLQGSFHQFVWCLIFLAALGLSDRASLLAVIKASVAAGLFGAVRLLPPLLLAGSIDKTFQGGFSSIFMIWEGLTHLRFPGEEIPALYSGRMIGWWEFDYYIGLAGVVFVVVFLLIRPAGKDCANKANFRRLVIPELVLILFSIGNILELFNIAPGQILDSERVPSRMVSLVLVFLLVQAVVGFQCRLDRCSDSHRPELAGALAIFLTAHDLWQHFKVWRVTSAYTQFVPERAPLHLGLVANHPDRIYFLFLERGLVLSLLGFALLTGFVLLEKRRQFRLK